jgi:hypothetical protein
MAEVLRHLPQFSGQFGQQTGVYPLGLDVSRSWNDKENLLAAQTLVPQFLAWQSPQTQWWVQFPGLPVSVAATHFVGVAGIGLDAAEGAPPNMLGVFGYDRATRLTDIVDGPENTIAVLQVPPEFNSPWLAGGGATVRGIPEIDSFKPFVCTEYKGKRGTFAIMANGDVRFIPESISDADFKAMCTIGGGEKIDADRLTELVKPEKPPIQVAPKPNVPVVNKPGEVPAPKPAPPVVGPPKP